MSAELGALMTDWRTLDAEWQRLRRIESLARKREAAEERLADFESAGVDANADSHDEWQRKHDRLATERAEAVLELREALAVPPSKGA